MKCVFSAFLGVLLGFQIGVSTADDSTRPDSLSDVVFGGSQGQSSILIAQIPEPFKRTFKVISEVTLKSRQGDFGVLLKSGDTFLSIPKELNYDTRARSLGQVGIDIKVHPSVLIDGLKLYGASYLQDGTFDAYLPQGSVKFYLDGSLKIRAEHRFQAQGYGAKLARYRNTPVYVTLEIEHRVKFGVDTYRARLFTENASDEWRTRWVELLATP